MYSAFDHWAHWSYMLTVPSMFSPCTQWVFGPLSPVSGTMGCYLEVPFCLLPTNQPREVSETVSIITTSAHNLPRHPSSAGDLTPKAWDPTPSATTTPTQSTPTGAKKSFVASLACHEHYLTTKIGLKPGMRVLDVGCSVSGPAREIARFTDVNIIGLNNNAFQVGRGTKYTKEAGLQDQVQFVMSSLGREQFGENSFDAVYSIEATCHASTWEGVYGEIPYNVHLTTDGHWALVNWLGHLPQTKHAIALTRGTIILKTQDQMASSRCGSNTRTTHSFLPSFLPPSSIPSLPVYTTSLL